MKRLLSSILSTALVAAFAFTTVASPVSAKACRDAKGKFAKCPPAMMTMSKKPCRDAKGKFTKCHDSMTMGKKH